MWMCVGVMVVVRMRVMRRKVRMVSLQVLVIKLLVC